MRCVCDCGNIVEPLLENLTRGLSTSCGHHKSLESSHQRSLLTDPNIGDRFGMLKILERVDIVKNNKSVINFKCACDCGRVKLIAKQSLLSGRTVSCGCCLKQYPEWFINSLYKQEDKQKAINGVLLSTDVLPFICECCGKPFMQQVGKIIHVRSGEKYLSCRCDICRRKETEGESELNLFLNSLGFKNDDIFRNSRNLLKNGQEIDFFVKSKNIGIEYNGDYWHSEERRGYYYHRDKFLAAEKSGIRLIQIFESIWLKDKEKIKHILKDILTTPVKIYARNCAIVLVDKQEAKQFYESYHLQGSSRLAAINYGLVFNNELIAIMGFGSSNYHEMNKQSSIRREDKTRFELHRFAVKFGYAVIGGASRLLKAFEKEYRPSYILSYSMNDWFSGGMYEKLGFKFSGYTQPRYYWVKRNLILNREECQLKLLSKKYPELYAEAIENKESNKETYIMKSLGFIKISNSGCKKWEKFINNY